jgi:hypothetical protein
MNKNPEVTTLWRQRGPLAIRWPANNLIKLKEINNIDSFSRKIELFEPVEILALIKPYFDRQSIRIDPNHHKICFLASLG